MFSLGVELALTPDLKGDKEFTNKKTANKVADALAARLVKLSPHLVEHNIDLSVKVDPFRFNTFNWEPNAWAIEITNGNKPTRTLQWRDPKFVRLIQRVLNEAKVLGLYSRIRRRGIHWPAGGTHLHVGIADLFSNTPSFLPKLALFEKNVYTDFANRPYIRWLFAEWFDNEVNSSITVGESSFDDYTKAEMRDLVYPEGRKSSSICARYSYQYKPAYPTYEFRIFDGVDSAKDIARNVRFLEAWILSHVKHVNEGGKDVEFTLKREDFKAFKNVRSAWGIISQFLRDLNLDSQDFRKPFEENYVLRVKHGEML